MVDLFISFYFLEGLEKVYPIFTLTLLVNFGFVLLTFCSTKPYNVPWIFAADSPTSFKYRYVSLYLHCIKFNISVHIPFFLP